MEKSMQISLSQRYRPLPTLFVFAALSLIASVTSILLLGELMIPIASAALASLFVLEKGRIRVFSIAVPVIAVASDLLYRGATSYLALEIVLLAVILAISFLRTEKSECAFWLTLTATAFIAVSMVLAAYSVTKELSMDSFLDFYIGMYEDIEERFISVFPDIAVMFGVTSENADPSVATALLESMVSILPSVAIIFAFAIAGITLKIHSMMLRLVADDESEKRIKAWHFALPSAIYYAFWIALTLKFFLELFGGVGSFAVVVANVYNVLLYVFAYVGFAIVVAMLSALFKSRPLAILATVGTVLLFSGLAIELIAYFGAACVFFGKRGADNEK